MTTETSLQPPLAEGHAASFLRREWPYLLMIALSLIGVAYSAILPSASGLYWQIIAPLFGAICIATQWPKVYAEGRHWRLIATQVAHWGVFALSMQLLFLPAVQRVVDSFLSALVLLYLVAISTFLVGVYYGAWRLCAVGVFLGLAIPAIALFQEAALGLVILAILVLGGFYLFDRYRGRREDVTY